MLWQVRNRRFRDGIIVLPVIGLFLLILTLSGTGLLGGDVGEFALAGGMVAPFVILALLAYAGEHNRLFRYLAVLWLIGLLFVIFSISIMLVLVPAAALSEDPDALETSLEMLPPETVGKVFLFSLCSAGIGLIGFSRRFRNALAQQLPVDPDSVVHTTALVCIISLIVMPLVPLIITGNAPFLNPALQSALGIGAEIPGSSVKLDAFSLIWTIIGSFFLVGLYVCRDFPSTLERLGLVRPTVHQVVTGIASGVVLVGLFWVFDDIVMSFFLAHGIPTTDENLVSNLFMVSFTPLAAVMASVSAGLGEELSIRGVIQPRFGILLSSLVFASLHAYQYAWDGLLSVFLVGICFGVLRKYTNTSTSAISHGVYDLTLFALVMAGITSI